MKNNFRKIAFVAVLAAFFAFGAVFTSPALAGSSLFDDSTNNWLNGSSGQQTASAAGVPCDPAQVNKGGLSFLP